MRAYPNLTACLSAKTTGIDHYTYRFSKKTEAEGLIVIDDPTSMLRCTNKVYLADLFSHSSRTLPKKPGFYTKQCLTPG